MASEPARPLTREGLRTPRVAAYAGIVFSVLTGTSMLLVQLSIPLDPPYESDWLDDRAGRISLAVALIPFAGIAFLWFMGVIRDQVGEREDRFFSTVFLGSGLLFLAGLFVWMTLVGAVLASSDAAPETWVETGAFVFGVSLIKIMGGVVTLRMAGVFMFSSGTIWLRTQAMPRWVVWFTYALSIALLVGGGSVRLLRLSFPLWVFIVSILVLRVHDRLGQDEGGQLGPNWPA